MKRNFLLLYMQSINFGTTSLVILLLYILITQLLDIWWISQLPMPELLGGCYYCNNLILQSLINLGKKMWLQILSPCLLITVIIHQLKIHFLMNIFLQYPLTLLGMQISLIAWLQVNFHIIFLIEKTGKSFRKVLDFVGLKAISFIVELIRKLEDV